MTFANMQANGQFVARYALPTATDSQNAGSPALNPHPQVSYPHNPNGATGDVAGICDPTGRVFGLMPHPERFVAWTQHPRWTRERAREVGDGLRIFQNAVRYLS